MSYAFISAHRDAFSISRMCRVLQVSRSGYYAWQTRPMSSHHQASVHLLTHMQRLHAATKARYGAVKLWQALWAAGWPCGRHRVARLAASTG